MKNKKKGGKGGKEREEGKQKERLKHWRRKKRKTRTWRENAKGFYITVNVVVLSPGYINKGTGRRVWYDICKRVCA